MRLFTNLVFLLLLFFTISCQTLAEEGGAATKLRLPSQLQGLLESHPAEANELKAYCREHLSQGSPKLTGLDFVQIAEKAAKKENSLLNLGVAEYNIVHCVKQLKGKKNCAKNLDELKEIVLGFLNIWFKSYVTLTEEQNRYITILLPSKSDHMPITIPFFLDHFISKKEKFEPFRQFCAQTIVDSGPGTELRPMGMIDTLIEIARVVTQADRLTSKNKVKLPFLKQLMEDALQAHFQPQAEIEE